MATWPATALMRLLERLERDDIVGLADFLSRLDSGSRQLLEIQHHPDELRK
jgi:hypothetical protein